jgi:hypothetical protein
MFNLQVNEDSENYCYVCMKRLDPTMAQEETNGLICLKCTVDRMFAECEKAIQAEDEK